MHSWSKLAESVRNTGRKTSIIPDSASRKPCEKRRHFVHEKIRRTKSIPDAALVILEWQYQLTPRIAALRTESSTLVISTQGRPLSRFRLLSHAPTYTFTLTRRTTQPSNNRSPRSESEATYILTATPPQSKPDRIWSAERTSKVAGEASKQSKESCKQSPTKQKSHRRKPTATTQVHGTNASRRRKRKFIEGRHFAATG